MGRPIDPQKLTNIHNAIDKFHNQATYSEIARIIGVSPATVRHHGVSRGVTFLTKRWHVKKVFPEGKFFNERARENWLV